MRHVTLGSFNLGHAVVKWSPPLQIWHPLIMVEEDDASRLGTLPLKKLISVLFKALTCFSIIVFETPYFYSSLNASYGVSPNSPNTFSSSTTTLTKFLMLIIFFIMHNFQIYAST
jgi:hypothetical protein